MKNGDSPTKTLCWASRVESESYVTTDGQSASLSWNKVPIWGLRTDFYTVRQLRVCWCGEFSLTRERVCHLRLLLALDSAVILGSESPGTRDHIVTRRLKVGFRDVHCYATTSQSARCMRCDRCYSTDTQQFLTVKFPKQLNCCDGRYNREKRRSVSSPEDLLKGVDLNSEGSVNKSQSVN
jgi:hypothetical protein